MKRVLLALGFALSLSAGAQAQPAGPNQLNGTECWLAGPSGLPIPSSGVGGPMCTNLLRGGHANAILSAISGNFTIGAPSGNFTNTGTPNMPALASGGNLLITAQPSAAVITMPALPFPDGGIISVCNVGSAAWATNAVTLAANTNQTLAVAATLTTLAAGTCAREMWNQSQATWYRVQ